MPVDEQRHEQLAALGDMNLHSVLLRLLKPTEMTREQEF
jgi:hypothetical protein